MLFGRLRIGSYMCRVCQYLLVDSIISLLLILGLLLLSLALASDFPFSFSGFLFCFIGDISNSIAAAIYVPTAALLSSISGFLPTIIQGLNIRHSSESK
jgi:hypothetical protein